MSRVALQEKGAETLIPDDAVQGPRSKMIQHSMFDVPCSMPNVQQLSPSAQRLVG
jgi:hypothetical protein